MIDVNVVSKAKSNSATTLKSVPMRDQKRQNRCQHQNRPILPFEVAKSAKTTKSAHTPVCVRKPNCGRRRTHRQLRRVKNATIGNGTKANHLTYIGDAEIGSKTNFGAGTIIANYDGVNKHKTVIGDEVRIGSNCVLVAPVTLGNKVTTGAGSAITRNCEDGKLVLARSRQTVIEAGCVRKKAIRSKVDLLFVFRRP